MKKLFILIFILFTTVLVGCGKDKDSGNIDLNYSNHNADFRAYNMLELGFSYDGSVNNPYDTNEIKVDAIISFNNKTITVPMFYYESYERSLVGDTEKLSPTNQNGWRLRYTPLEAGSYSIKAVVNSKEYNLGSYEVKPGNKDANLRVSSDNAHLEFSNGNSFVGIGHNLCGWEWAGVDNMLGTYEYDNWFTSLKQSGANMVQFDLCEGDNIEWTKLDNELPTSSSYGGVNYYNQQSSWKMDYKVKNATDLGLYFRFSLFHWEDFDNEKNNFPDWGWSRNPYNSANGGPADNVTEFFTTVEAKKTVKDYLRYAVARWGYSTNLMAWELWNEVDAPEVVWADGESYHTNQDAVTEWHKEMAAYLKELDPNKHLITTSFASSDLGGRIWQLDEIDITTFHRYTMYNSEVEGLYESQRALYNIINARLTMYNKPVIAGEFALSPGGDIQRENDLTGIAMHNQLWASIFSGSFGTAMHWTWGSYVDRNDLYSVYKGISSFIKNEDLNNMEFENNLRNSTDNYYLYKIGDADRSLIWIRDKMYDFYQVEKEGYVPQVISNIKVNLIGLKKGDYVALYYDTESGEIIGETPFSINGNSYTLNVIDFTKDIAIKVIPANEKYEYVNLGEGRPLDSVSVCGDSIRMYGSGGELAGMSDEGLFTYLMTEGDFVYTAKISEVTYSSQNSKAGIMIRQSLSSNAKMVYIAMNGNGSYNVYVRYGSVPQASGWNYTGIGSYFRVERTGDIFKVYVSQDGINFNLIETLEFSKFADEAYVGLAVCAGNTLGYNDALFENVKLERKVN